MINENKKYFYKKQVKMLSFFEINYLSYRQSMSFWKTIDDVQIT